MTGHIPKYFSLTGFLQGIRSISQRLIVFQIMAVLAFLLITFQIAVAAGFSGEVVSISDGDTVSVMHDGKAEKIRLNGIDCPESRQAFGTKAKQFTSDLVFGKTVTIEVRDHDKYGRTVGEVILSSGQSLNRELVRAGLAWWYRQYSSDQSLGELESEAKAAKRGLWADPNPIPPWDFRHNKKKLDTDTTRNVDSIQTSSADLSEHLSLPGTPADTRSSLSELLTPGKSNYQSAVKDQPSKSLTVYITKTGKKYHQAGCRYLARSSIPIPLSDAKANGYGPCSVCFPPP